MLPTAAVFEKCLWEWLILSLLCGLLSALGFVVTTFVSNYYIGMTVPILIYYVLLTLYNWVPMPTMLKISTVYFHIVAVDDNYASYFIYALLYTLCHLVFFYMIAKVRIERRLEHA